jgi:hypothetical protein
MLGLWNHIHQQDGVLSSTGYFNRLQDAIDIRSSLQTFRLDQHLFTGSRGKEFALPEEFRQI